MVIDGGAAAQRRVTVGSRLLAVNGQDATKLPYAKCLDMVKTLPRPLTLVFEKSLAACDTAKGWVLVRKSAGSLPPSSMGPGRRGTRVPRRAPRARRRGFARLESAAREALSSRGTPIT